MSPHQRSNMGPSRSAATVLSRPTLLLFAVGAGVLISISAAMVSLYVSSRTCGNVMSMLRTAIGQDGHQAVVPSELHHISFTHDHGSAKDTLRHQKPLHQQQEQRQEQQQQQEPPMHHQNGDQQQLLRTQPTPQIHPMVGYYQCHSRPKAVEVVLQRWRAVYPQAPMFMVNDGGDPSLAALAAKYNANYTYSAQTSPVTGRAYVRTVEEMRLFMDRIFAVCQFADYVIRVEDDVIMYKPITLATLQYDITGDNRAGLLPNQFVDIINQVRAESGIPKLNQTHYGGFGGTVLRGAFFREMQRQGKYKHYFELLAKPVEHRGTVPLGTSQLLTCLVYMHGGTIGRFPGLVEYFYKDAGQRVKEGSVEVLHGEKSHYGNQSGDGMFVGSKGTLIRG